MMSVVVWYLVTLSEDTSTIFWVANGQLDLESSGSGAI
jgi:hypothetical protein